MVSEEVARKCVEKPVLTVIRQGKLRCYGHVKRREGEGLLGEELEFEISEVRPMGRSWKNWRYNIEEDLREINLREIDTKAQTVG